MAAISARLPGFTVFSQPGTAPAGQAALTPGGFVLVNRAGLAVYIWMDAGGALRYGLDTTVEAPGFNFDSGGALLFTGTKSAAIVDLVDAFGTADGTIADVTATPTQALINDNFKDCQAKINGILAALRAANVIS